MGDQSSGKSSVLESLTGYYFPRSVGLCTRHATEIVCRRENTSSIVVTIQPFDATFQRAERAKAFRREILSLKGEEFANVLKDVSLPSILFTAYLSDLEAWLALVANHLRVYHSLTTCIGC